MKCITGAGMSYCWMLQSWWLIIKVLVKKVSAPKGRCCRGAPTLCCGSFHGPSSWEQTTTEQVSATSTYAAATLPESRQATARPFYDVEWKTKNHFCRRGKHTGWRWAPSTVLELRSLNLSNGLEIRIWTENSSPCLDPSILRDRQVRLKSITECLYLYCLWWYTRWASSEKRSTPVTGRVPCFLRVFFF